MNDFLLDCKYTSDGDNEDYSGEILLEMDLLIKLLNKTSDLYEANTSKYLVSDIRKVEDGKSYITVKKKPTAEIIKKHFLCKHSIALFPVSSYLTKWFVFDIDVHMADRDGIRESFWNTQDLILKLKEYIPEEYINCYRSGSKGFHVAIYLEKSYSRQEIQEFQKNIVKLAGLTKKDGVYGDIEILPRTSDFKSLGSTAKLPLSRNFKNIEYDSNFCCFVNTRTLQYKPAQYKYFLQIKQLDIERFKGIIKKVKKDSENLINDNKSVVNKNRDINNYFDFSEDIYKFCKHNKITEYGQRHNMTFLLLTKLKTFYKLSEDAARNMIFEWLSWQEGKYSTSKEEALKDTEFQVKYVYSKGYEYTGRLVESAIFTKKDIDFCIDIVNERGKIGCKEKNAITLLIAMIRHSKLFISEEFFMSRVQMMLITDIKNKNMIGACIGRLEELDKIEVVERVNYFEAKAKANTYRVNIDLNQSTGSEEKTYELKYDDLIDVLDILKRFYRKEELKKFLTKTLFKSTFDS